VLTRDPTSLPFSTSVRDTPARLEPIAARRRAARGLIALGAGAGLDGRWATQIRARDVVADGATTLLHIDPPSARTVPVLAHWEQVVAELAATAGQEFLVGGLFGVSEPCQRAAFQT
jgi:hypothetical protein